MGLPKSYTFFLVLAALQNSDHFRLNDEGNELGNTTDLVSCLHLVQRVFDGESRRKAQKFPREWFEGHRLATECSGFSAKLWMQNHKLYIGRDKNGIWFFIMFLRFHSSCDTLRREGRENHLHQTVNHRASRPPDIHDGHWIGVE